MTGFILSFLTFTLAAQAGPIFQSTEKRTAPAYEATGLKWPWTPAQVRGQPE